MVAESLDNSATRLVKRGSGRAVRHAPPLLLLAASAVAVLMLLPPVYLLIRATDSGMDAFDLLMRSRNRAIIRNSVLLAGAVGTSSVLIGLPFAWLLERTNMPLRRLFSILSPLPLAIPSYVGALTYIEFLGPEGDLKHVLADHTRIKSIPSIYGFWGAFIALTLFTFPYVTLQVRATLSRFDPSIAEAARSLGHGPIRTFFRTSIPMLRPSILAGSLLAALYAISDFGVVTLLRYDTFTRGIYTQYQSSFNRSNAAVLAAVLVVFSAALVSAEVRLRGRAIYHRIGSGARRTQPRLDLGNWRWLALGFCATVMIFAVGVPVGVIVYWLVERQGGIESTSRLLEAVWHSVLLGGVVGLVTLVLALPVAILSVRFRNRLSEVIERICYLGFGLPGIVIALTMVFFGIRVAYPLYQTVSLLIIALAIRFLPQALGAERASLLTVNPRLEEAARGLGRGAAVTFARITLPLSWSGFVAGGALVFVNVMKELPITLLLSPIEYRTLATEIWTASGRGAYSDAAVPALILVVIASIPTFLFRSDSSDTRKQSGDPAHATIETNNRAN